MERIENSVAPQLRELTAAQQLLWTGQKLDPASPLYNMALVFSIDGSLQVDVFLRAFQTLVDGCDALRTTFLETPGGPRRQTHHHLVAHIDYRDISADPEARQSLASGLKKRTQRCFRLDGPFFDCALFRLGPERFVWYFNQHHLITDASSTALLFRRMGELYQQGLENRVAEPISWPSYEEFAEHERAARNSRHGQRAEQYWRQTAEKPTPPTLFYGGPPRTREGRSRRLTVPFGLARSKALRDLARRPEFRAITDDLALFHIFATVLLAYMHRVGDAQEPGIAAPSHNRSSAALRETVGLLTELFPLSVPVEEGETFASLANKTARVNQQRLLHAATGASPYAPVRDVVLNYIKGGFGRFADMSARAEWIPSDHVDPKHKLRLQVYDFDRTGEFRLDLDLNEEIFGEEESDWAGRHLLLLVDALLADPAQSLSAPALTSAEEAVRFTPAPRETPSPPSVVQLFAEQADRTPGATAIVDGDVELSYRELHERARLLAVQLQRKAVEPDQRVGVCLPRSADLIVAMLGVLESGAAYVPLDPSYPDERLAFIASDSSLQLILTTPELTERTAPWAAETLTLDTVSLDLAGHRPSPRGDHLAYVLYTSGSTGRPKGVMITRAALANYVSWARRKYTGAQPLHFPLFTSPSFDFTITSIFTPLVSGGSIIVYRGEEADNAFIVRRVIEDDRADIVKLTPSHLALVRDLPLERSRIRAFIFGGEDLPTELAASVHDASGGRIAIYNEYGPTEATVGCMIHRFDPKRDKAPSVPIGRPADNVHIAVLDKRLRPVPRGTVGEIVIGGPGVARGYLGREQHTRASFVPDSFRPGGTLYRSGDLGRWNRDGCLEFLGRSDVQIKWRGARIEPGEVEAALAQHPDIRQSAAKLAAPRPSEQTPRRCVRCGLEENHPEAGLNDAHVCAVCRRFEGEKERVADYFQTMNDLERILREARASAEGPHDCLMLYSGGKDSTYALCKIVDMGACPLVFLLDNGYISEQAKQNVRRVVDELELELVVGQTPAMDAIFADSLRRYSNVCNGCFKTIYTLSMQVARQRGIRTIVTGLSRGQIFETRLADLYRRRIFDAAAIDRTILEARKAYHRMDDEVARSVAGGMFRDDAVFDEIRFVDFYRYCDATLDEVMNYIGGRTPWIRPSDTGRSTNCRINEVGIFVHKMERGFHNYSLPYSWDVRLGHKQKEAAVEELDDDIDVAAVRETLHRLAYRERSPVGAGESKLVAYYAAEHEITASELRRFLADKLPPEAIPASFARLEALPLTPNGKVDRAALPEPGGERPALERGYIAPRSEAEKLLAEIWAGTLGLDRVGADDNYFELGGDSIQCIQIVSAARQRGWSFSPRQLFDHPTVAELARAMAPVAKPAATEGLSAARASEAELAEILEEFGESAD